MLKETDFIKNYIKNGTKQTKYSLNFEDDIAVVNNFAYSTDVNNFSEQSFAMLKDLDVWVVDCVRYEPHYSHSHLEQTLLWIDKYKPKKAILTHLGAWLDYDKLLSKCPNNVEPAYDGLTINLT